MGHEAVMPDKLRTLETGKCFTQKWGLHRIIRNWSSLVAQLVKHLPAMWETWAQSLGWEDPLEKGKATHSSILAWRSPQTV